jgi:sugar lactone lactonase YvrE/enterochelin esterase-like enzyme
MTYPEDAASREQPGVPKGELIKRSFTDSKIFPGTVHDYWIYVPAQYQAAQPACLYVNQDGIQWKAPTVFDNLINGKEMPVTIGVFITPGKIPAANPAIALDRFNRSYEYDGLGDNYVRFLLEELLPDVEKQRTADGREIHLSKNAADRAIGGSSSGAVCAFTAAWERPDVFSRVFSAIGTYVGLRGAERYPTLIRKTAPKPLRIFLQDGTEDLNIYAGDWWKANETMERALTFAGYEVNHVWGSDGHNGRQGTAIFPEAMRWLWKGWPAAVNTGFSRNQFLSDLLIPGNEWEVAAEGFSFTEGTAVNAKGELFFQDIPNSKSYKLGGDGKPVLINSDSKRSSGSIVGPDGKLYVIVGPSQQVVRYDAAGKQELVADQINGNDLVVANNGNVYVTAPEGRENPGKIFLIRPNGEKVVVDVGLKYGNGISFTPDQSQLYVTESSSHWVWIFSVNADGTLSNKQKYGWLHVRDNDENSWSDGLKCDTAGRVYVATRMGIQIMDQVGRVNAILTLPGGADASNLCFAGADFNTLYVASRSKIYKRKLRTKGANAFDPPMKPMNPRL